MNLIQIATGMGTSMRFGDLPKYSYVISKINEILPVELTITATTTGVEFLTIYKHPDKRAGQIQFVRVSILTFLRSYTTLMQLSSLTSQEAK